MSKPFIISNINIAKDLELNDLSVKNTVELFEDGATIPFIAGLINPMNKMLTI